MHHSRDDQEIQQHVERINEEQKLGPTGEFPDGKITDDDRGEIKIAVGVAKGKVILSLGSMGWISLDPQQARGLAESLRQASYRCK